MNKLIVFACFWNEAEWIDLSLKQLKMINPDEVILCDGCFDLDKPKHSTDGTYQRIKQEVGKNKNYKLVEPIRVNILEYHSTLNKILREANHLKSKEYYYLYFHILVSLYRHSNYRVNQALTFNYMITLSELWDIGNWMMTYDCDQFYEDSMIQSFNNLDRFKEYNLLTAEEYTFFDSFKSYTKDFEYRNYSNMPHKILENTLFVPTRRIVFFEKARKKIYKGNTETFHLGNYFHYKFSRSGRLSEGYKLGDRMRERPELDKYHFEKISKEKHPSLIVKEID